MPLDPKNHPARPDADDPAEMPLAEARPTELPRPRSGRLGDPTTWVLIGIGALGAWLARDAFDAVLQAHRERELATLDQVRTLIDDTYVLPREPHKFLDDALRGLLQGVDRYSRYYDREERRELERQTSGTYLGLGLMIADVGVPYRVLFPIPGSPADLGGIQPGDRLLEVAGLPMPPADPTPLEDRIKAANGRPVLLEIESPDGTLRKLELRPTNVVHSSLNHVRMVDDELGIGYVNVATFTRRTPDEFDAAIGELRTKGLKGLILDLRGNRGGVLDSATALANRFVSAGVLVTVESRRGRESVRAVAAHASLVGMPLVVLIDSETASAAEVFAAAIQDHRAGVLVGELSLGKGTVQTLTHVPEAEGIVKLTTAHYITPAGRLIERSLPGAWDAGLDPDVEFERPVEERRAIDAWLGVTAAPLRHVPALEAWERRTGEKLLPERPADPHLDIALGLLRGRHPDGVHALPVAARAAPGSSGR